MQALGLVWGNIGPFAADLKERRRAIDYPIQFGARLLFDHWQALQARGGFVVGRDVPSRKLACVLRNLALFVPTDDGKDFRARLAGTAYMRRFGIDITGLMLSEILDSPDLELQQENLADVVRERKPCIFDVRLADSEKDHLCFESLRLPVLSPDSKEVWVLSGLFYSDWA